MKETTNKNLSIVNRTFKKRPGRRLSQECDFLLIRNWEQSQVNYTFNQLIEIFPQAKPVVKKLLKEEITKCEADLLQANELEKEIDSLIYLKVPKEDEETCRMILMDVYVKPLRQGKEQIIKRNSFRLSYLNNEKQTTKGATDAQIETARQYPIDRLMKFNRGVAVCPWHTEKTPSLHYYKKTNTVYCFGCHKAGDSISIFITLFGGDFINAVKKLS